LSYERITGYGTYPWGLRITLSKSSDVIGRVTTNDDYDTTCKCLMCEQKQTNSQLGLPHDIEICQQAVHRLWSSAGFL